MPALSPEDLAFWDENGYVILHDAAPQEGLDAVIDAIWEFLGMDRNNPDDWYREPHQPGAGMVHMHQHPALWKTRESPKIYEAFSQVWNRRELWVTMDRANMKPPYHPDRPEWDFKGFLHWDVDTSKLPIPMGTQGVLYLTDTDENQGGFQCVPGMHRRLTEWVKTQPTDRNPRVPDLTGLDVKAIPGKAGDLLIWHWGLPHGNGRNTSDKPRLAQYISMWPAHDDNEDARWDRVRLWRDREQPPGFPGDPRRWEKESGKTAELSPLGRKLLGLDRWGTKHAEN